MIARFLYWLKMYFGFSNKESKGFVLVLPILLLLMMTSFFIRKNKMDYSKAYLKKHQLVLDSLMTSGVELSLSPDLTYNPSDTLPKKAKNFITEDLNRIDFSLADSSTLQIVPGIGPGLSGRIIKYKEALGGVHDASQLHEIYGLTEETVSAIWEYFEFSPAIFRTIPINLVDVNELASHPYINYSQAKVLVAYRTQHGTYQIADDLLKIRIFKEDWIRRIEPYLDFEHEE